MSIFTITPFEQFIAEALTGLIITGGQKGDAVAITKRATTALNVATAITSIASGDAATGIAALQQAATNANLDPGVNLAVQGAFSFVVQTSALNGVLLNGLPIVGATTEAIAVAAPAAAFPPSVHSPSDSCE
jgi:hypothetical protein